MARQARNSQAVEMKTSPILKVVFTKRRVQVRGGKKANRWYVRLERCGRVLMWSEHYTRLRDAAAMVEHCQSAVLNGQVKFEYHPKNDREVRRWIGELAMRPLKPQTAPACG
jgi:hypothetical protein